MNLIRLKLLLIACLVASTASVWAQTSAPPITSATAEDHSVFPEAPSATWKSTSPPPAAKAPVVDSGVLDTSFVAVNELMFSSSIANVELTTRCMNSGACADVPGPFRSRGALYGIGLPLEFGVALLEHRLRRSGHHWWSVPAAIVTTGNIIYGVHAGHYMH